MKTSLTLVVLSIAVSVQLLQAQNIDMQEMRQDIEILESVLEEVFDMDKSEMGGYFYAVSDFNDIQGTYLPGYGALFQVPGSFSNELILIQIYGESVQGEEAEGESVQGEVLSDRKRTTEEIKDKLIDFLVDYGPTLDQLENDAKLTVLYGRDNHTEFQFHFINEEAKYEQSAQMPVISVTANMADLIAYQRGDVSKNELLERVSTSVMREEDIKQEVLEIFANILEAGLEDEQEEQFEIESTIDYTKIDSYGVLYSFEVGYGNVFDLSYSIQAFSNIEWDSLRAEFAKLESFVESINLDSLNSNIISLSIDKEIGKPDSLEGNALTVNLPEGLKVVTNPVKGIKVHTNSMSKKMEANKERLLKETKKALQQFLSNIKELIIEYGPTLDSVSPNQALLFSIEVNSGFDELPERVALQVEKSVLRAVEGGEISEEQAMEEIMVQKYQ